MSRASGDTAMVTYSKEFQYLSQLNLQLDRELWKLQNRLA